MVDLASDAFIPDYFRTRGWWRDETLGVWLMHCASTCGESDAIITAQKSLSYARLAERVAALASGLHGIGIAAGDVVAVHLPNILEFPVAWFAINARGAVMQTIHLPYGMREVEHLLRHSGARAVLALSEMKGRSPAAEIAALALTGQQVIAVGGKVAKTQNYGDLVARGAAHPAPPHDGRATDPFLRLYTSGTTSAPKAVSVTFNHFLSNARLCAQELGIGSQDRLLCLAPYTHLYGLYALELGFAVGAAACLLPMFTPPDFIEALKRTRPTVLIAGPAHIAACIQQNLFDGVDLGSIRFAVLSGTTVPIWLSQAFEAMLPNGKVLQAWGMTELQFGACSRMSDSADIRFGTIGHATPGTQLRVADIQGRVLPPDEAGELQVRGCSLFSGYVGNHAENAACFTKDGWFRTGDLASMDAMGNVRLNGRTKELINRGGVKFNPVELEAAIALHPAVAQVAIAPVPDKILGERAACFVVLHRNATLDLNMLTSFLAEQRFAKFTWPEQLEIVAEMPMTPTRKIMKSELVRRFLESSTAGARSTSGS
ncbi:MAG: class I adenylate-forming enzyme family protein [Xanthobacteraceae bacterium]